MINNLIFATKYAQKVNNIGIADRVSRLATWDQIIVLTNLDTLEKMLFYAKIAAENNFSTNDLEHAIKESFFEKAEGGKFERGLISAILKPSVVVDSKKKGNSTLEITRIVIALGDDLDKIQIAASIFNNPHFVKFVTTYRYRPDLC